MPPNILCTRTRTTSTRTRRSGKWLRHASEDCARMLVNRIIAISNVSRYADESTYRASRRNIFRRAENPGPRRRIRLSLPNFGRAASKEHNPESAPSAELVWYSCRTRNKFEAVAKRKDCQTQQAENKQGHHPSWP